MHFKEAVAVANFIVSIIEYFLCIKAANAPWKISPAQLVSTTFIAGGLQLKIIPFSIQ